MTILDSYAVLAFMKDEPAASEVEPLLTRGDASLTALGVAEVLYHLVRLVGADEENASLDLAQLGLADSITVTDVVGAAAGRLRARHYHRVKCPVSLADCVAAEVARTTGRPLATSDPPLLEVCEGEGIAYVAFQASDGTRWPPGAKDNM